MCHFSPSAQAAGLASQRQQGSDSGSLPPQGQGGCWLFLPIGATKLELFRVAPDILVRCCIPDVAGKSAEVPMIVIKHRNLEVWLNLVVALGEIPAAERGLRTWDGGAQEGQL